MSQYEDELAALVATKCPECNGSGTLDDAELGDIFFHTWTCDKCKGSGKKQETKGEHRAAEVGSKREVEEAGVGLREASHE